MVYLSKDSFILNVPEGEEFQFMACKLISCQLATQPIIGPNLEKTLNRNNYLTPSISESIRHSFSPFIIKGINKVVKFFKESPERYAPGFKRLLSFPCTYH